MADDQGSTAFVPGHVTGFFSVHRHDDPERTGSRGAGITLSDGVTVRMRPAETSSVLLDGRPVEVEPVERVLATLGVEARVLIEADLPIGTGFGVSGASALGTALTANSTFGLGHTENELITVAHVAEVQAGTGLGDVVAQARGGVPVRLEPGGPEHNRLDGVPARPRVEYVTFEKLPTGEVLAGDTTVLSRAGEEALERLLVSPTMATFAAASKQFAREVDLTTRRVEGAIEAVEDAGGRAAMAMLGETVFALGTGLSDAGYDVSTCETHPGAMLVE